MERARLGNPCGDLVSYYCHREPLAETLSPDTYCKRTFTLQLMKGKDIWRALGCFEANPETESSFLLTRQPQTLFGTCHPPEQLAATLCWLQASLSAFSVLATCPSPACSRELGGWYIGAKDRHCLAFSMPYLGLPARLVQCGMLCLRFQAVDTCKGGVSHSQKVALATCPVWPLAGHSLLGA